MVLADLKLGNCETDCANVSRVAKNWPAGLTSELFCFGALGPCFFWHRRQQTVKLTVGCRYRYELAGSSCCSFFIVNVRVKSVCGKAFLCKRKRHEEGEEGS